ncbi:MAG TPA: rhomboid family intramembrane serine protease [Prolixibacteraceae bacterium]|nr:rhomboid family intramembrane serine protease [Prolixibacteraceae bacterium]
MNIWDEIKHTFKNGSIVTRLIYVNLAVFLALRIVVAISSLFNVDVQILPWLALPSDIATLLTRPWTLLTYMFLHFDFLHILFNILWLYWFGKIFLNYFDEKKLLGIYLIGGLSGGVFYIIAYNVFPAFENVAAGGLLLGASASIIAIVVATAVYVPNLQLHLFPISALFGPIKIIWIALISVLIYFIGIAGTNAGGNIAHLGGALWGYLYMAQLKKGNDFMSKFNNIVFNIERLFKKKNKLKVSYRRSESQNMNDWDYNKKKKVEKDNINVILDKIAKSGYDSLSKNEKEVLFKMDGKGKPN